ncbi:hypothetical protein M5D96_012709 [Drosophila gunungcola]|uniref:Uncharacterized protein n=1 Tax=Drosophila gunungcola TaxID=103775 RepID=A0A9Q0BJJ9_9MUSC|nr:hypothetical protein M5D96_012709 [Drosophila gunungcola]
MGAWQGKTFWGGYCLFSPPRWLVNIHSGWARFVRFLFRLLHCGFWAFLGAHKDNRNREFGEDSAKEPRQTSPGNRTSKR